MSSWMTSWLLVVVVVVVGEGFCGIDVGGLAVRGEGVFPGALEEVHQHLPSHGDFSLQ